MKDVDRYNNDNDKMNKNKNNNKHDDKPNLARFVKRSPNDEDNPHDELDPPPASMRRLSYLDRSASVFKIPLNDSSYIMVSSNNVSPASTCSHHNHHLETLQQQQPQQQQQVVHKQPSIIIVEPHNDESVRCNCRNCQFLSGWCCMPTILLLVLVLVIFWLCMRGNNPHETIVSSSKQVIGGNGTNITLLRSAVEDEEPLADSDDGFPFFG